MSNILHYSKLALRDSAIQIFMSTVLYIANEIISGYCSEIFSKIKAAGSGRRKCVSCRRFFVLQELFTDWSDAFRDTEDVGPGHVEGTYMKRGVSLLPDKQHVVTHGFKFIRHIRIKFVE